MNIEEIRIKKQEAEYEIRTILKKFYDETGVIISEIDITIIGASTSVGTHYSLGKVECKVLL